MFTICTIINEFQINVIYFNIHDIVVFFTWFYALFIETCNVINMGNGWIVNDVFVDNII